jgi:cysteine-rich repeat protein
MRIAALSNWLTLILLAAASFSCGRSDDDDKAKKDSGTEVKDDEDAAADESENESGATTDVGMAGTNASTGSTAKVCGNEKVESPEECDDGNLDNTDGCNALCEWNCKTDSDCDDDEPCNGTETCDHHECENGKSLAEGDICGPAESNNSCWKGICSKNICGDKLVRGDEKCDDGDLDATNGCTPACQWTCEKDVDCSGNAKECVGDQTCNVDHLCIGTPVGDRTDCSTGWCISGECVPKGCGDGTVEAPEECDKGPENGKAGAGCTLSCKVVKCGNGELESGEQCDDGNSVRLDGCDPNCKIELAHRWTKMHIIKGPPPDFCKYQSNRFGEAYSGTEQTIMMGTTSLPINVLEMANERINQRVSTGEANTIVHVFDSSDNAMQTTDSHIQIGIYDAMPAKKWIDGPPVDFPFYVLPEALDKTRLPKVPIVAEQAGGGKVASKEPSHVVGEGPTGKFEMYDAMLRYTYDVSKMSAPQSHNRFPFSHEVVLPEAMGASAGDPSAAGYSPSGIMCGAMTAASQQARLIDDDLASMCCKTDNTKYRSCANGKTPPDCDTYADVLKGGCTTVCFTAATTATSSFSRPTCQPGCGLAIVVPIEPDVDTNADGTADAYSSVIAFEGKRVRIAGVAEE